MDGEWGKGVGSTLTASRTALPASLQAFHHQKSEWLAEATFRRFKPVPQRYAAVSTALNCLIRI